MADKKPARPKQKVRFGWRGFVVTVLTTLGVIAGVSFMLAHWTERQVLTTDNWVALVGPLPQNDQVATALSTYTVNQVFDSADIEARIQSGLPDKVAFLAPVLTQQLQARVTNRTQQIIQSNQFEAIWTTAIKTSHQRLLEQARNPDAEPSRLAQLSVKLQSLRPKIQALLGQEPQTGDSQQIELAVNLHQKMNKLGEYVRLLDWLNATLWLAALACLFAAFVLAQARRKLLLVVSASFFVIALLQLIGVRALRPTVLNLVENEAFRPAVGIVYDDLLALFRHSATLVGTVSAILFAGAFATQRKFLRRSKTISKQLDTFDKSSVAAGARQVRQWIRSYRWPLAAVVFVVGLVTLAFVIDTSWQGIIRTGLVMIIAIELINLVAARPPRSQPM